FPSMTTTPPNATGTNSRSYSAHNSPDSNGDGHDGPEVSEIFQRPSLPSESRKATLGANLMSFFRRLSTGRLLALFGGVVVLAAGSAAGAIAATSGGPTPPPKSLAQAVHDAVTGPAVSGVTAQVTFTDHLIDTSAVQGSDPLLPGASGRLWAAGNQ